MNKRLYKTNSGSFSELQEMKKKLSIIVNAYYSLKMSNSLTPIKVVNIAEALSCWNHGWDSAAKESVIHALRDDRKFSVTAIQRAEKENIGKLKIDIEVLFSIIQIKLILQEQPYRP